MWPLVSISMKYVDIQFVDEMDACRDYHCLSFLFNSVSYSFIWLFFGDAYIFLCRNDYFLVKALISINLKLYS